jgi:hypothetical protein
MRRIYLVISTIIVLVAAAWSTVFAWNAHQQTESAAENLQACRRLASEIEELQRHAQHTSLVSRSLADLAKLVESAAKEAGISSDSIVRIDPQAARRVGDTDYQEQATLAELLSITLPQFKTMVEGLASRDANLEVRTVRLRSPREASDVKTEETWIAEMVLTQRIYAPKTARP